MCCSMHAFLYGTHCVVFSIVSKCLDIWAATDVCNINCIILVLFCSKSCRLTEFDFEKLMNIE